MSVRFLSRDGAAGNEAAFAGVCACWPFVDERNLPAQTSTLHKPTGQRYGHHG